LSDRAHATVILGPIHVIRYVSEAGHIGYMVETYGGLWRISGRRLWQAARLGCRLLSAFITVELSPDGGEYIGVWPVCPFCLTRRFVLANEFNEEDVTCQRCGGTYRIRGVAYPYTMVGQ
jgi:hypothetical protein